MTAATSSATRRRDRRPFDVAHVGKSAASIGFLAVAVYEAAAPVGGYVPSTTIGYAVAVGGLVLGGLLGAWR